ncbi:hypothetical protein [Salinispora arenicola]|uniref:hypothetical protein n=1 Tax=Salinispora arenicola TaxID=168697 RepID=UPI00048546D7|nr:hypothetical protein [Salinispora arenicola]
MNLAAVTLTALATGTILGITLGIHLGRRIERVAWHADAAIARARLTGWLLRDLIRAALTITLAVALTGIGIWTLLTS